MKVTKSVDVEVSVTVTGQDIFREIELMGVNHDDQCYEVLIAFSETIAAIPNEVVQNMAPARRHYVAGFLAEQARRFRNKAEVLS